mmetsp:Transcript_786/g.1204  ORF Transcript_786/g.1204 Transcript_786/m.1204 type:complete len:91 (+) Transcript_786:5431-5703(+)
MVKPIGRLKADLEAILFIMRSSEPPLTLVRGRSISEVRYGFGDAAGSGFGSSWEENNGIRYRFGVWGSDKEDSSSNLRELENLVDTLDYG